MDFPALAALRKLNGLWPRRRSPPTPLFASDAPIHVTIQGPMTTLASNRAEIPRTATMTVDGVTYPITLTPRGITRKTSDICDFPPLRVELIAAGAPRARCSIIRAG